MAKKNHLLTEEQLRTIIKATEDSIVGVTLSQENINKAKDGDLKFIDTLYTPTDYYQEDPNDDVFPSTDDILNTVKDALKTDGNYVSFFLGSFVIVPDTNNCYIESSDIMDGHKGIQGNYEIFKGNNEFDQGYYKESDALNATSEIVLNRVEVEGKSYYNFELAFGLTHDTLDRLEEDYHDALEPVYEAITARLSDIAA
jgi:hypothetical protein